MKEFFTKYNSALWCLVAALWFFIDYFFPSEDANSLLISGIIWVVFAFIEFIKNSRKK